MRALSAQQAHCPRQERRDQKTDSIVGAGTIAGPQDSFRVGRIASGLGSEDVMRHCHREVEKHAEETKPREELNYRELAHGLRHLANRVQDLLGIESTSMAQTFFLLRARRIFLGSCDGHQHCADESNGTDPESYAHYLGNAVRCSRGWHESSQ